MRDHMTWYDFIVSRIDEAVQPPKPVRLAGGILQSFTADLLVVQRKTLSEDSPASELLERFDAVCTDDDVLLVHRRAGDWEQLSAIDGYGSRLAIVGFSAHRDESTSVKVFVRSDYTAAQAERFKESKPSYCVSLSFQSVGHGFLQLGAVLRDQLRMSRVLLRETLVRQLEERDQKQQP